MQLQHYKSTDTEKVLGQFDLCGRCFAVGFNSRPTSLTLNSSLLTHGSRMAKRKDLQMVCSKN